MKVWNSVTSIVFQRRFSRPENRNKEQPWKQNWIWATLAMTVIWTSWIFKFLGCILKMKFHWFVQFVGKVIKVTQTWIFIPKFTWSSNVKLMANVNFVKSGTKLKALKVNTFIKNSTVLQNWKHLQNNFDLSKNGHLTTNTSWVQQKCN